MGTFSGPGGQAIIRRAGSWRGDVVGNSRLFISEAVILVRIDLSVEVESHFLEWLPFVTDGQFFQQRRLLYSHFNPSYTRWTKYQIEKI